MFSQVGFWQAPVKWPDMSVSMRSSHSTIHTAVSATWSFQTGGNSHAEFNGIMKFSFK